MTPPTPSRQPPVVPYLTVQIQNEPCQTLLDTGAAYSCINTEYANYLKLQIAPIGAGDYLSMAVADGRSLPIAGKTTVPITIRRHPFHFECYVMDDVLQQLILGSDFLRHFNVSLNVGANTI